jgi:hypothetical protein
LDNCGTVARSSSSRRGHARVNATIARSVKDLHPLSLI